MGEQVTPSLESEALSQALAHLAQQNKWGEKGTKPLQSLLKEVAGGDCVIEFVDGNPTRRTSPIFIHVFYENGGRKYRLVETKQVFKNGEERTRELFEKTSLGEKAILLETPLAAAQRAIIKEEMAACTLSKEGAVITQLSQTELAESARSYPGLSNKATITVFSCTLKPDQGEPMPFQEEQDNKITYFEWTEISPSA